MSGTTKRETREINEAQLLSAAADAAHACRQTAEYIAGGKKDGNRAADYFLFVKGNQPSLRRAVFDVIQEDGPRKPDHTEPDYGHGRIIRRSLWVTDAADNRYETHITNDFGGPVGTDPGKGTDQWRSRVHRRWPALWSIAGSRSVLLTRAPRRCISLPR